ncbi:MAG: diaminopimelate decarboxylase [Clostridia bacterium]|nr:diaminopimelate decarboxylase [Clostridia bacterium]
MFIYEGINKNEKGHLTLNGHDLVELAKEYGTPLIVYDREKIIDNINKYKNSIDAYYDSHGKVLYAGKAFSCLEMCRLCKSMDCGLDVVSEGEIFTALKADFPAEDMFFHGNNKTDHEINYAVSNKIGYFVVDNISELEKVNEVAKENNCVQKILLRIKPGIEAHTHSYIQTGQIDSKFGFALETGEALSAVKAALVYENLDLKGFHCHIGSQIFSTEPFVKAAQKICEFIAQVKKEENHEIDLLDLGGGFGIKYTDDDESPDFDEYMKKVSDMIKQTCKENDIKLPYVLLEPGRSIVGEAGITLYTAGAVKVIPEIRTYVSVDGGMTDNPRYILYESEYMFCVANKVGKERNSKYTFAGKCCESGDLIGKDVICEEVAPGDIIAVFSTGAYNYSMASHYNKINKPAVLMLDKDEVKLIIKRETLDSLITNEI